LFFLENDSIGASSGKLAQLFDGWQVLKQLVKVCAFLSTGRIIRSTEKWSNIETARANPLIDIIQNLPAEWWSWS